MPRLRNNILANYVGQFWIVLMGLAFVPIYLRELGAENFGLVGFMLTLQSISVLLDFGIGAFLSREIARRISDAALRARIRQLIRSFEWLVWPIAFAIALCIMGASEIIASSWLKPQHLSQSEVSSNITIMALAIALLWPSTFYTSIYTGLEQQTRLNIILAFFATLRYAGVVPLLFFSEEKLQSYLAWFAIIALIQTAYMTTSVWRLLPSADHPPRFCWAEIISAKKFAFGIFIITATSIVITQADRLVLSTLRPLSELGLYTVAVTISAGIGRMVQPMFNAIYPRMSRLVATNDESTLSELYHLSSQCLCVVITSIACLIGFYAESILLLWTGDDTLAKDVALPLAILVAGTALNGLMNIPYALQLAHGYTRLAIISNFLAIALGIPFCIIAVKQYGMTGAASMWLGINFFYVFLVVPIVHRHWLKGEALRWYLHDLLPPIATACVISLLAKLLLPSVSRDVEGALLLSLVAILLLGATAMASSGVRDILFSLAQKNLIRLRER